MGLIGILGALLSGGGITTKKKPVKKEKPKQDFSSPGKRITDLDHDFRFETIPALLLDKIQGLSNITRFDIRRVGNRSEVIWYVVIVFGARHEITEEFRSSYDKNTLLEKYNGLVEYARIVNSTANFEMPWRDSRLLRLEY